MTTPDTGRKIRPRNVYMVWTAEYYRIMVAHSHSGAKLAYAREDGWGDEYFEKSPEGFWMSCRLLEKNVPYGCGWFDEYVESAGVDLMLSGCLMPMYLVEGFGADDEYDYRRWDGFRKPLPDEMEHYDEAVEEYPKELLL